MITTQGSKLHIENLPEIPEDQKPTPVEEHKFVRKLSFINRGGEDLPLFLIRKKPYNFFHKICFRLVSIKVDNFPKDIPA